MRLRTSLGGIVWDSGHVTWGSAYGLLPTKTSLLWSQLYGGSPCCRRIGSQVRVTVMKDFLSRLIFVAVILSLVSLVFMALYHRVLISFSLWWSSVVSCPIYGLDPARGTVRASLHLSRACGLEPARVSIDFGSSILSNSYLLLHAYVYNLGVKQVYSA
jgi:hypothetical protein